MEATVPARLVWVGPQDSQSLSEIIALADHHRRTLGFLPPAAFFQASSNGTLLAAVSSDEVAGYALYSLPRQVVRLTQLCVSERKRGSGIARMLIEAISERHSDRLAVVLKCRKDYPVNGIWPHLGFACQGEVPGRSRKRLPLALWRRDHGHPDLFSTVESLGLLRVALDVNVFLDLEMGARRQGATESLALAEDWLADQVDLVVTAELRRELMRLDSERERSRQVTAAGRYRSLSADAAAVEAVAQRIISHVARTQQIDLATDRADVSDVRHVAEAFLAGVTVMATRDDRLLRWSAAAADACGVRVMRPADVVLHVDELARAQAYRPVELEETRYRLSPVRSGAEDILAAFLNEVGGERKPQYLATVRQLLAEGRRWDRILLLSPAGEPVAFYVIGARDGELEVPLFRIKSPRLERTIARQLLFLIRDCARREGQQIIKITDPHLTSYSEMTIRDDGFLRHDGTWTGLVISACADSKAVDAVMSRVAQSVGLTMPALRPSLSPVIAAELERTLWPAKITDSDLPSYLVPIRHVWSADLFGVPRTLLPRPDNLGLSREHVYYRSPRPRVEQAPARLVWYVSGSSPNGLAAVIGCSRLEEVVRDTPAALYSTYRHLGVWSREQITRAAHNGQALALRFTDTEIFPHQIPLRRLYQLAAQDGQKLSLRSSQKISARLFAAIYQEGHQDT